MIPHHIARNSHERELIPRAFPSKWREGKDTYEEYSWIIHPPQRELDLVGSSWKLFPLKPESIFGFVFVLPGGTFHMICLTDSQNVAHGWSAKNRARGEKWNESMIGAGPHHSDEMKFFDSVPLSRTWEYKFCKAETFWWRVRWTKTWHRVRMHGTNYQNVTILSVQTICKNPLRLAIFVCTR